MVIFLVALLGVVVQRLLELRLARRNLQWALSHGGKEYAANHYPLFFLLHIGWLVGWTTETLLRGVSVDLGWVAVFLGAQALRYWAIATLGSLWNTRIVIVPGAQRVSGGPYRWIPHPNYLAVGLELLALPLAFGAWTTALVASALNLALLLGVRIPAEERALREYS